MTRYSPVMQNVPLNAKQPTRKANSF